MKALFIIVVIHVFMASATRWYQYEPVYPNIGVKFWTYPFKSNHGGYSYSNNRLLNYVPFFLPYGDKASQGTAEYTGLPLYNYAKNYQNHSYGYNSAASNIQKTGTGDVAFSIYGQLVNPLTKNPHSNQMYLPGLNLNHNGSDLYIPSIDYVIKKLLLRLRNPWKKLIDIENALNLRSSYEPYWDSIIDEFVEKYFHTNPGLSNTFEGTDISDIVTNFANVMVSFTDFLKLRWGIPLLNSNENLSHLFDSLVNYKTTPENLNILYKEEITQNYFNNKDQHSSFHETEQLDTELSNHQKIPGSMPPIKIPPINPNDEDKVNTLINDNEYSSTDGNSIVEFNHQHQFNKYFNHYDVYGTKTKHITDNISKNEDLQNSGMNTEVGHNYSLGWNNTLKHSLPPTMKPTSEYNVDLNNYNGNEGNNDLNKYPTETDNINSFKNICETLAPTFEDLTTIVNNPEINIEVDNIKRLFEIVRQFIYIYNFDNIPFADTVTIIGNILLENNDLQANKMDIKNGLEILLDEFQNGGLGKLFEDVKYGRVIDLKLSIDILGNLLYKYKQTLLHEGISEMSMNLLLHIAKNKSEKILSDYFAEECKRKTSDYIWKKLYPIFNLKSVLGGKPL